jgi:threonine aldolase
VAEPLGTVLIELPQREIGGQLPSWEELTALLAWTRERNIPIHLDGARLWECQPFYQRSYAEIAALFDSVYVSFYKILDGIAGSILAGTADVIAEARIWQRRHGGNLVHLYPYVLSAQRGLEKHLGRIPDYCAKAREVAATLAQLPQIEIVPDPPQTNMMHVYLRGEADRLNAAALTVAQETGTWLFYSLAPTPLPNYHKLEFTVGEATLDLASDEIFDLFARLFSKCE